MNARVSNDYPICKLMDPNECRKKGISKKFDIKIEGRKEDGTCGILSDKQC